VAKANHCLRDPARLSSFFANVREAMHELMEDLVASPEVIDVTLDDVKEQAGDAVERLQDAMDDAVDNPSSDVTGDTDTGAGGMQTMATMGGGEQASGEENLLYKLDMEDIFEKLTVSTHTSILYLWGKSCKDRSSPTHPDIYLHTNTNQHLQAHVFHWVEAKHNCIITH
jgi:hypothetical protein